MDKFEEFLTEWMVLYLRNRNLITRNLLDLKCANNLITAKFKDKEQLFIIKPFVENFKFVEEQHLGIVMFNTEDNFRAFLQHWDELAKYKNLSIYFVNPFSQPDKRWVIFPYTHKKVCDDGSVKLGLRSIFETVQPITREELEQKI